MKIALIGYGKMGKELEQAIVSRGHEVTAIIDPYAAEKTSLLGHTIEMSIDGSKNLSKADAAIEFSKPGAAFENIKRLSDMRTPTVVGTTNWYDKRADVEKIVETNGSSIVYAPNFSIGVNLFYRIAQYAARLFNAFGDYDVGGFEVHHNEKLESPSGTAKVLVEKIMSEFERKKRVVWETINRPIEDEELHFASMRVGAVPGTHSVLFDSPADGVQITHTARNRYGFAYGALFAAEWLIAKPRRGVFTIDDVLDDLAGPAYE
ncbi:MAG: 4-hydroxy-tetrahydrodipicolinate reductase [Treponema sp.]|jgi:4-hydroxy-tetrahydrodipicolinate reductase|nr:4-hydroxy-tetrahydrodipicolinate reductase [Treponema sp.]